MMPESFSVQPTNYKKVRLAFAGDSQSGKTTTLKAMQAIYFMELLGIHGKREQTEFYNNPKLVHELRNMGKDLIDLFDAFGFRAENSINFTRLEDFANMRGIKENIEPHPRLNEYFEKREGRLKIKIDSPDVDYNPLYEDLAKHCGLMLMATNNVSLKDIVMNTSTTKTYSLNEAMKDGRKANLEESVWVDIGGEWVQVTVKDVGGQDKFGYVRPALYNDIDAEVVFFSITDSTTLANIGKFPTSFGFPKHEELDGVNLALLLKFLKITSPEDFQAFTYRIPDEYRNDPDRLSMKMAKADTRKEKGQKAIKTIIEEWFPENSYQKFLEEHKKYKTPTTYGWLQEIYNTRFLLKMDESEVVMVPVLIYGNKSDLMEKGYADLPEERIVSIIGDMGGERGVLPYATGSSESLSNVKKMFQLSGLMALSASKQITPKEYNEKMKIVCNGIDGTYSLAGWFEAEVNVTVE